MMPGLRGQRYQAITLNNECSSDAGGVDDENGEGVGLISLRRFGAGLSSDLLQRRLNGFSGSHHDG
jgi:hypothetical protein